MSVDLEPALAREARRLLEAEAAAGYNDSATPGGLSRWIAAQDRGLGALGRLSQYSRLRPRTREDLARAVLTGRRSRDARSR